MIVEAPRVGARGIGKRATTRGAATSRRTPVKMARRSPVPIDFSDRARALALVTVSRETLARLDAFVTLLLKWQSTTNLVARSTLDTIWTRHIADSLQLLALAPDARVWVDLGSGGGFPGLVLACGLADIPGARVHLVESNAKKAAFLREAARALGLPALVHAARIEDFIHRLNESVDIVTARALAPLADLLGYAEPFVKKGAQGLFPKGQDVEVELTEASKYWRIDVTLAPSVTSADARIVMIRRAERR
jgi:16S rRNA (guanine527-N7)-methyltransferase